MTESAKTLQAETGTTAKRRVGRPTTLEIGGGGLALILNLIRAGAATTRLDIERAAQLKRAVVTDRLSTLLRFGLIEEGEFGLAKGGRAPRHLRFRPEAGALLVAVVERSSLAVALADLSGRLLVEHHEGVDLASGPDALLERLTTLFIWLLDERGGKNSVWRIGLALPEPVLVDTNDGDAFGIAALNVLQAWRGFDFRSELSLRFGVPCMLRSGTQAMAMGELRAGAGQGLQDLLFVNLGRSISAGIVADGVLHTGAQGFAGTIGHAATGEEGGVTCHCGSKGCLQARASGEALAREGNAAARDGRSRYLADMLARLGDVSAEDVGHGAQLGDAFCAELLARCGKLVGESLAPLVNLLNPAMLVLGGSVAESGEIMLASVREAIYRQSHALVTRDLRIVRSQMGGSAGLVGAAQILADDMFSPALLPGWIALGSPRKAPAFLAYLDARKAQKREAATTARPPGASGDA